MIQLMLLDCQYLRGVGQKNLILLVENVGRNTLWIVTHKVQVNEMGCDGMLQADNLLRFQG